jgi:hypothetical protein
MPVRLRAKFAALGTSDENLGSLLTPLCGQPESILKRWHLPSILFVILFITWSCILSVGRRPPQPSTSTFHASTELVSVPVVVRDRYGNRVHGLTKNDFRILENGHEVEIRSFESMANPGLPTMARDPAKVQTVVSRTMGAVPIILFFDQLNTPANEQSAVRRRLALWYLAQQPLTAPPCVVLYTGSMLRIVQQPTMAAAKVRAAIESIPTTINSEGAGAAGELPLPAGAMKIWKLGLGMGRCGQLRGWIISGSGQLVPVITNLP